MVAVHELLSGREFYFTVQSFINQFIGQPYGTIYFCQYILKEVTYRGRIKQSTDAAFSRSSSHHFTF